MTSSMGVPGKDGKGIAVHGIRDVVLHLPGSTRLGRDVLACCRVHRHAVEAGRVIDGSIAGGLHLDLRGSSFSRLVTHEEEDDEHGDDHDRRRGAKRHVVADEHLLYARRFGSEDGGECRDGHEHGRSERGGDLVERV